MLSINTNLSSLIAQNSMKTSTNKLNQAIERMTTGAKINHAKDNAANYSISTNMTTKIGAYKVAEDNVAMGMDMVSTASDTLAEMQNHAERLRSLATQARNGTYGVQSLEAIQSEANALTKEIERLYSTAEYNGVSLFNQSEYPLPEHLQHRWGKFMEVPDFEETEGFTVKTLTEAYYEGSFTASVKYSISNADELKKFAEMVNNSVGTTNVTFFLTNDIDLENIDNWTPIGSEAKPFGGIFNGNGFTINNLKISSSDTFVGFFGVNLGTIKNLGIEYVDIKSFWGVGSIIGLNYGNLKNSYASGSVEGDYYVGGLVGVQYGDVIKTYSDIDVIGYKFTGGAFGVAGYDRPNSIVSCYAKGSVIGEFIVGGLIGNIAGSSTIFNSNSYCKVEATNIGKGSLIGGITTKNHNPLNIVNCQVSSKNTSAIGGTYEVTSNHINITPINYDYSSLLAGIDIINKVSSMITLQIGINSDWASNLEFSKKIDFEFSHLKKNINSNSYLEKVDDLINILNEKQTELGSVSNRLESVLDEISIQYENLVSSRSTIRDVDMAEVSSQYIQQQILQQAAATLMATANQSPAIALQLI